MGATGIENSRWHSRLINKDNRQFTPLTQLSGPNPQSHPWFPTSRHTHIQWIHHAILLASRWTQKGTLFPTSSTHACCKPSPLLCIGTGCCLVPGLTLLQSLLCRKQLRDAAKCESDLAPRPKWANSCPSKWKQDSASFLCPGKPCAIWPGSPPPSLTLLQLFSCHITRCHLRAFAPVVPSVWTIHPPWKICRMQALTQVSAQCHLCSVKEAFLSTMPSSLSLPLLLCYPSLTKITILCNIIPLFVHLFFVSTTRL